MIWYLTCDDCGFEWTDANTDSLPCPECGSRFVYAESDAGDLWDSPMMQARRGAV